MLLDLTPSAWAASSLVQREHNISEYVLSNGFRVILAPNPQENKVYINTIYRTGAFNDPKGQGGLAHLLEHLAFKGTQNIPTKEFQRRLDQYTLFNNASTSYYATQYTNLLRPQPEAIRQVVLLEAERMDKLLLKPEFVPSEIEIVKREREMRMDQPFAVVMEQIWQGLYGDAFLGRSPIGNLDELKSIQLPELQKFYRTWYAPNNAVMVLAGQFDAKLVLNDIEQQFSQIAVRNIPASARIPPLNLATLKQRTFQVQKGSQLAKYHIYLQAHNATQSAALDVLPELLSLQPSGYLYQNLVESGTATTVQASTWMEPDFQVILVGANYAPNMDAKAIEQGLQSNLEPPKAFNATELKRVQQLVENGQDSFWANSSAVGAMLSRYVVAEQGNWRKYFSDHAALMALTPTDINTVYRAVLTPQQRIQVQILPTAVSDKTAKSPVAQTGVAQIGVVETDVTQPVHHPSSSQLTNNPSARNASTTTKTQQAQPLLDTKLYQQQLQNDLQQSAKQLKSIDAKIERGQLSTGFKYAIFPTSTRDAKTYATISLQFGNAKTLQGQAEALDILAYLLLRGTAEYDLQAIADKSIAAGGSAVASIDGNTLLIYVSAKHNQFNDYLAFVLDLLQKPSFSQSQFDLILAQKLASLNRPYSEPQTVAGLTLARATEKYPVTDLRHHFEPDLAKQALQKLSREDIVALYTRFVGAQQAQVAVTGLVNVPALKKVLQQRLLNWTKPEGYAYIGDVYTAYGATRWHALAEPREFGFYLNFLSLPVGVDHPDAPALMVLSHILGDSQLSSRLAKTLREDEGLVYGFNSNLALDGVHTVGALSISAHYSAGKAEQVSQAVKQVMLDLRQQGITQQELAAAQADILKQRVTILQDERNIHAMLIVQLQRGKTLVQREQRDQAFAKLSTADINRVIQHYLKPDALLEVMADQYGQNQSVQPIVEVKQ